MAKDDTSAVAIPMVTNDIDAMRQIRSYQDALDFVQSMNIEIVDSKEFGDGFELTKDKAELVSVPFVILGIKSADSDYGTPGDGRQYVVIHLVTSDGRKRIIVDGGTGLAEQALDIMKNHPYQGLGVKCEKGLTRSDYVYVGRNEKGEEERTPATTFYLS